MVKLIMLGHIPFEQEEMLQEGTSSCLIEHYGYESVRLLV
jgi:hypothetical protein